MNSQSSFDVIIIGAGISGICAAYHLKKNFPNKSIVILEKRSRIGGTWDVFQYPGIRSDSDMYTFGYSFNPWTRKESIANGGVIINYLHETMDKYDLQKHIRFGIKVHQASFSSKDARWTIECSQNENEKISLQSQFLFSCSGYYDNENGYSPQFKDQHLFQGQIIHPQRWPRDLDYSNKTLVVIGSGATAVTLLPALSEKAKHVVMLQRSPTYTVAVPKTNKLLIFFVTYLPSFLAGFINRWYKVLERIYIYYLSRKYPVKVKAAIIEAAAKRLPEGYDIQKHFTPSYDPWDQRICAAPDGDFYQVIKEGKASVVTDTIEKFIPKGIQLSSGTELNTDIIVTATGLNLQFFGGMKFIVDGEIINEKSVFIYKGLMVSRIPNFYFAMGYINSSWTLKCDLTASYMCRVLRHMDYYQYSSFCPIISKEEIESMELKNLMDLKSNYIKRSLDRLPKQGNKYPWKVNNNYLIDWYTYKFTSVAESNLKFN